MMGQEGKADCAGKNRTWKGGKEEKNEQQAVLSGLESNGDGNGGQEQEQGQGQEGWPN